ncbi:MAG TPA: branched-chain amino acid ABC transporter permease [Burkholderiaceae bacterium]|nr:branched-chain amino acid ABC transporter permease [Burkholderiaceae bacterium]
MELASIALHLTYAIALLVLTSMGLAVIYGMMRVINFAHGEFLMVGGYSLVLAHEAGVPLWIAMFIVAPLVVGALGLVIERVVIRHLYGRILDTILATWGISLLLIGLASTLFGHQQRGVAPPFGSFQLGAYRESYYSVFVIGVTLLLTVAIFVLLRRTRWGLTARGTMQNPRMAEALRVNTRAVYAWTFAAGAAISGLAGAVLAPLAGVVPTVGLVYVTNAFITVISGGANAITGTLLAATLFGTISEIGTRYGSPVIGLVALLLAAVVVLRLMPAGITGRIFRRSI